MAIYPKIAHGIPMGPSIEVNSSPVYCGHSYVELLFPHRLQF